MTEFVRAANKVRQRHPREAERQPPTKVEDMGLLLLVLLLVLLFGGLGFAVHTLWVFAVIFAIVWLAGFAFRSGEGARWYHW